MRCLNEGALSFRFPDGWQICKYDDTSFQKEHFNSFAGGSKGVDFVALSPEAVVWLIEVKDYRSRRRQKPMDLFLELAQKVRATLSGLVVLARREENPDAFFAQSALAPATAIRIVLHLEQPHFPSKLFPRLVDPKNLQDKLKQSLRPVDPHPLGGNSAILNGKVPWVVS